MLEIHCQKDTANNIKMSDKWYTICEEKKFLLLSLSKKQKTRTKKKEKKKKKKKTK